jgi:cytochrome c oxidase cbb3-type subunit IV
MSLDLNLLRALVTLLSFAGFAAIVVWACARVNRERFAEAAALPFADDVPTVPARPADALTGARHE